MSAPRQSLIPALLALLIVLTSATMAVARVGMSIHGTVVLCIGTEAVSVNIGPDGLPESAPHVCADCLVGPVADTGQTPVAPAPIGFQAIQRISTATFPAPSTRPRPSARAPPLPLA